MTEGAALEHPALLVVSPGGAKAASAPRAACRTILLPGAAERCCGSFGRPAR